MVYHSFGSCEAETPPGRPCFIEPPVDATQAQAWSFLQGMCSSYRALTAVVRRDGMLGLHHFSSERRMVSDRPSVGEAGRLPSPTRCFCCQGDGDLGVVELVCLKGTSEKYAMKTIDKRRVPPHLA